MNMADAGEPAQHSTKRLLAVQWFIPLCLFAIAATYETLEHLVFGGSFPPALAFASEIVFFGIIGPVCVGIALAYIGRLLKVQVEAKKRVEEANQTLEATVAERTSHLEQARLELQENNKALSAANAELRQLDQMKSDFVALVSHSFRAPLTNMSGALELIAQESATLPENIRARLTILANEGERLADVVTSVLDVTRLESGSLKLNLGPVAVGPLLRRAVDASEASFSRSRIALEAPPGLPLAWADETYIDEVVRNLLSNALKYSPENSIVHVAARAGDREMVVSVTDHGPGVCRDEREKIFRAFERGGVGESRDPSGLGLGLYFVRRLVEAHQGRIWIESPARLDTVGGGSRFVFTLPLAPDNFSEADI